MLNFRMKDPQEKILIDTVKIWWNKRVHACGAREV